MKCIFHEETNACQGIFVNGINEKPYTCRQQPRSMSAERQQQLSEYASQIRCRSDERSVSWRAKISTLGVTLDAFACKPLHATPSTSAAPLTNRSMHLVRPRHAHLPSRLHQQVYQPHQLHHQLLSIERQGQETGLTFIFYGGGVGTHFLATATPPA